MNREKLITGSGVGFFFFFVLLVSAEGFPRSAAGISPRIVGGIIAPLGAVPYHASILPGGILGSHACSGSILNEYWIITTARCVSMADLFYIVVGTNTIGQNYWDPDSRGEYADLYIIHEEWDSASFQNDIALLRFRSPIIISEAKKTAPVKLPEQDFVADGNVTVSGWGATSESDSGLSRKLRMVDISVIPQDECLKAYDESILKDTMICAGVEEGGKDRCLGDLGAPLVDTEGRLVGMASWGYGCARPEYPGVYTKVSAYHDWIKQKLAQY